MNNPYRQNFQKKKQMARSSCIHVLCMQALLTPSRVFNINTQSTYRRALKPSQDKEDRWTCRYGRERADSLFITCTDLLMPLLFVWKLCMKSQAVCIRVYLLTWTMYALWCIQTKFWWQHRDKSSYICAHGTQLYSLVPEFWTWIFTCWADGLLIISTHQRISYLYKNYAWKPGSLFRVNRGQLEVRLNPC